MNATSIFGRPERNSAGSSDRKTGVYSALPSLTASLTFWPMKNAFW
ncbi:MAG: hypothetical protein KAX38_09970 [Candidatus Krumholzibacteria bacterium]|nr:hypothetical protein [Candidatus Krumholzibacteria bacterium]